MRQIGGQTHSYIRHIFDSLRVLTFVFMLIANIAATQRKPAQIAPSIKENPSYLPFGSYPHIHEIVPEPKESDDLGEEIEDLSTKVRSTVKTFAQHRNSNCFGDPCLIQAFPLIYTKKNSGFFGGVRANLINISRADPKLFSVDASIIRSDTAQWLAFLAADFPEINFLPLDPRLKVRTTYSRTTETRYFGTGNSSIGITKNRSDDDARYGLKEIGIQSSLVVPVTTLGTQQLSLFSSIGSVKHEPSAFINTSSSVLFEDSPRGIGGGISSRLGLGVLIDSRDQELQSRTGWALEASFEHAGNPLGNFNFERVSFIDRRYISFGQVTFANRLTVDNLWGDVPFWELTSVGGVDPISNISGSPLLLGFENGRFHERTKIIDSFEIRWQLKSTRFLGQRCKVILTPLGISAGRLGLLSALSASAGVKLLFNGNFLVQTFASVSEMGKFLNLDFGQEF